MELLASLVGFLIALIVIIIVAAIVLWAVRKFFPEAYTPARYIVGGIALIVILLALLRVIGGGSSLFP